MTGVSALPLNHKGLEILMDVCQQMQSMQAWQKNTFKASVLLNPILKDSELISGVKSFIASQPGWQYEKKKVYQILRQIVLVIPNHYIVIQILSTVHGGEIIAALFVVIRVNLSTATAKTTQRKVSPI